MESQPQNPEFRTNPENFHLCSIQNEKGMLINLECFFFVLCWIFF